MATTASSSSGNSRIAECMLQLVRGQQPAGQGEKGVSSFNITASIFKELINIASESDRNKLEIFMRNGLRPATAALHASYGVEINALAADLIGLIAEANDEQAKCCATFKHEGICVVETLLERSRSKDMRIRTSARAALYSMHITPKKQNEQVVVSKPPYNRRVTAPAGNLVPRGIHVAPPSATGNLVARGLSPPSIVMRKIFEGDLVDEIFRSVSYELGQEWNSLATQLNVPYQTINKLQTDFPHNTGQQCFQMLREHWFNRQCEKWSDEQIKSRLKQALQHRTVGRNDLADRLDYIIMEAKQRKDLQQ